MRTGKPAFLHGEAVKFIDSVGLGKLLTELTTENPLSIHQLLSPQFLEMGERQAIIDQVRIYHFDVPLYQIRGSEYQWPEAAFVDFGLDPEKPAEDPYSRASLSYVARVVDGYFDIQDKGSFSFCRLHLHNVTGAVARANQIAEMRTKIAFEILFGFEGKEEVSVHSSPEEDSSPDKSEE